MVDVKGLAFQLFLTNDRDLFACLATHDWVTHSTPRARISRNVATRIRSTSRTSSESPTRTLAAIAREPRKSGTRKFVFLVCLNSTFKNKKPRLSISVSFCYRGGVYLSDTPCSIISIPFWVGSSLPSSGRASSRCHSQQGSSSPRKGRGGTLDIFRLFFVRKPLLLNAQLLLSLIHI